MGSRLATDGSLTISHVWLTLTSSDVVGRTPELLQSGVALVIELRLVQLDCHGQDIVFDMGWQGLRIGAIDHFSRHVDESVRVSQCREGVVRFNNNRRLHSEERSANAVLNKID